MTEKKKVQFATAVTVLFPEWDDEKFSATLSLSPEGVKKLEQACKDFNPALAPVKIKNVDLHNGLTFSNCVHVRTMFPLFYEKDGTQTALKTVPFYTTGKAMMKLYEYEYKGSRGIALNLNGFIIQELGSDRSLFDRINDLSGEDALPF